MYKQVEYSNWQNTGYTGGWCLKFVEDAFHTAHQYGTAEQCRQALINEGNYRTGKPPLNIEVPIFFSIAGEPAGHIAIRLVGGKVASSSLEGYHSTPYIHNSIEDLERFYSSAHETHYLGWSVSLVNKKIVEYINDVKDIKKENMYIVNSKELKRNLLVVVDNNGISLQTFTNADDLKNIQWGADISRQIHSNNNDFCSHFWTYSAIREYYKDWSNRQKFINDILKCAKGKHLFYRRPRAVNE